MNQKPILIRAAVVAPMDRPIVRDGGVFCASGRIIAVGPVAEVRKSLPPHEEIDLGRAVLLPGLVNAHTHLELSDVEAGDPPAPGSNGFAGWIVSLAHKTGRGEADYPDRVRSAIDAGVSQCVRYGVTAVGDITANPGLTRPRLKFGPLRVISFGEALGLAQARDRFDRSIAAAIDATDTSERLHIGLSPHSPYTVDLPGYHQCLQLARERQLPLCTHLAETEAEATFLQTRTGPFREIWNRLGTWADPVPTFEASPIAFARAIGLLDLPLALLAHVNYLDEDEMAMLAGGQASVVYCPRTHAYFGHPRHKWREMLDRGINVCVGTDSCASSPNLNVVDDLRLLWSRHGHAVDAEVFWRMVTTNGAHALGKTGRVGSITPGKLADLTAFACTADVDPLGAVLDDPSAMPIAVWIGGKQHM